MAANSSNVTTTQHPEFRGKRQFSSLAEDRSQPDPCSHDFITAGDRQQDVNNPHSGSEPKQHALMGNTGMREPAR